MRKLTTFVGMVALFVVSHTYAQNNPPSRAIRLSKMEGQVSFLPSGESQWVYASRNRPLITGDSLWNDAGTLSELQIPGARICLGEFSNLAVLNLNDDIAQFQLTQGILNIRVHRIQPGQFIEIDTPNLAMTIQEPGYYRIQVDPEGDNTIIEVRNGQAQVYAENNAAYTLAKDETFRFYGTDLQNPEQLDRLPPDPVDRFCGRPKGAPVAINYVSPDVVGYEDLDTYGSWQTVEDYGTVWTPTGVDADWAPYRDGTWNWVEPWGWSWVGQEPWGFAPYHYGRWGFANNAWFWVPGAINMAAVYAPALVAFLEAGAAIGWFPLGPGDVYIPPYAVNQNYFMNVNRSNGRFENNYLEATYRNPHQDFHYRNRQIPSGVTVIPTTAFVQAVTAKKAMISLPSNELQAAKISPRINVSPQSIHKLGTTQVAQTKPSAQILNRGVIAKTPVITSKQGITTKEKIRVLQPYTGQPQSSVQQGPAITSPKAQELQPKHGVVPHEGSIPAPTIHNAPKPINKGPTRELGNFSTVTPNPKSKHVAPQEEIAPGERSFEREAPQINRSPREERPNAPQINRAPREEGIPHHEAPPINRAPREEIAPRHAAPQINRAPHEEVHPHVAPQIKQAPHDVAPRHEAPQINRPPRQEVRPSREVRPERKNEKETLGTDTNNDIVED